MRVRIKKSGVHLDFEGSASVWNECLRPHLGGPEAPSEPEPAVGPAPAPAVTPAPAPAPAPRAAPAPAAPRPAPVFAAAGAVPQASGPAMQFGAPVHPPQGPRTWYPPRPERQPQPEMAVHLGNGDDEDEPAPAIEPSGDPAVLYPRLAAQAGRRSERDALLAAVWFLAKGERDVSADEVERHLHAFGVFPDVKVLPHLLKHVSRTKMLDLGQSPRTVRLSKKGLGYVRSRLIGE